MAEEKTATSAAVNIDELNAARAKASVRHVPKVAAAAVRLTWEAAPRLLAVSVALQLLSSAGLALQILLGKRLLVEVLQVGQRSQGLGPLVPVLVLLVAVTTVLTFLSLARNELSPLLTERVGRHAMGKVLDVAVGVELVAFESSVFHDRMARAVLNSQVRPLQMTNGLIGVLGALTGTVGVGAAVLFIDPLFLLIVVVAYVPVWFATRQASRAIYEWTVEQTARDRERNYLQVVLTRKDEGKELRSTASAQFLRNRYELLYDARISDLTEVLRRRLKAGVLGSVASSLLTGAALAVLLWLVQAHRLSAAGAAAAAAALFVLGGQLRNLAGAAGTLYQSSLFIQDFTDFLVEGPRLAEALSTRREVEPEVNETRRSVVAFAGYTEPATLTTTGLGFRYPTSQHPALQHIDMRIESGSVVALVGENGSGKTTLAKLLAGLYQPTAGHLHLGGDDVTHSSAALRERSAVVFQDFVKFQLSAAENIGLGRWERASDRDAIRRAAQASEADDFLSRLPWGYDSVLVPYFTRGVDLSGGQWQRVALARAYFRDAPFVVLDEPTAALDPRAEAQLFANVRSLFEGRSVLIISHRFSTVRSADHIYVLEAGRIAEEGNHASLMAREGVYAELFNLQASAYGETSDKGA